MGIEPVRYMEEVIIELSRSITFYQWYSRSIKQMMETKGIESEMHATCLLPKKQRGKACGV